MFDARVPPGAANTHGAAQWARLDDVDRLDVADLLPLGFVVLLDVPGVVGARFVDESPELVPPTGEDLATRGTLVDHLMERAVRTDLDAQELIFQQGSPVLELRPNRGDGVRGCSGSHITGGKREVRPTEPGDGAGGGVDEQTLLHRLCRERRAVRSGHGRRTGLSFKQERERAGS